MLFENETYTIRGACFEVYNTLGFGFLEAVYQEALALEFKKVGVPYVEQKELTLQYKGMPLQQFYKADFVWFDKIVVELKAVAELKKEHVAQVMNYLKATGLKLGLLANFGNPKNVEIQRIVF